jgi:hypothetical protein
MDWLHWLLSPLYRFIMIDIPIFVDSISVANRVMQRTAFDPLSENLKNGNPE